MVKNGQKQKLVCINFNQILADPKHKQFSFKRNWYSEHLEVQTKPFDFCVLINVNISLSYFPLGRKIDYFLISFFGKCLISQKDHGWVTWDCLAWMRGPAQKTTRLTQLVQANGPMTQLNVPRGEVTTAKAPPIMSSQQIREILHKEMLPPFIM